MAYEAPITIKKAIDNIRKKHYVLPSIQREFVWDTDQIEKLFDSLMRDYPISTFLFWKVEKHKIKDFQFYEFLKNYHEKTSRHNKKADLSQEEDVIAILDGQQRMTSMYIGLTGTYSKKLPYYGWNSPHAFPEKKLYLNLLKKASNIEFEYDFRFLTSVEASQNDENHFWFSVSEIMELSDMSKVSKFLSKNGLLDSSKYNEEKRDFAIDTLNEFYNVVHQKGSISYFLEEGEELDKVLQIFIRINSGGTKLSYSDLLLSIATAQWNEKDAREVIHEFVDDINKIGDGFDFNKDFVLKACLVLSDFQDIKFKVDNFTKQNMEMIEQNWEKISNSIRSAIELVAKYGYYRENLLASNAIIPIAYFIYKNSLTEKILHSGSLESDRKLIMEWLSRVLLKGTFGGTPDGIYPVMRNIINQNPGRFPLSEIVEHYRGKRKSISFSPDDVESILDINYGTKRSYSALSLLYSSLNFNFKYHQDHIHPKSFFNKRKLKALGILDEKTQDEFILRFNKLANLQLLQATSNVEKKDKPFEIWLSENFQNEADKSSYLSLNHIHNDTSLKLDDFLEFYEKRRADFKSKLMALLNVKAGEELIISEED
ncbi:DUF262 domain-containing protein [Algoriphagus halophilus]|uniref:Uncharacterized conserved protein, contains ParB-like and HNH nuclease domains n=1 Tax=Algoriphagus halophilus TaxID=226505 RepID=A0A1N6D5Z8_9BACT|nr:DUF262 domain-containing protein [Algoriphagus halophilus]SIN66211.1 Uncharacterized conserved protein, contains ParB-like and HNH nuclease domains [Algoriphagus halophilus]